MNLQMDLQDNSVLGGKKAVPFEARYQAAFYDRLGDFLRLKKALLIDRLRLSDNLLLENGEHMRAAAEWLAAAQDATADGGVAALYSLRQGWDVSYPETTGYIIPTLFDYAHMTGQNSWRDRAIRMVDWLLSKQLAQGGFLVRADHTTPAVFDTGQIILGLVSAFRETGKRLYLDSAVQAARWLISIQEPTGAWRQHSYGGFSHTYHSRVAWAVLEVYQDVNEEEKLLSGARKHLEWAIAQQLEDGWFKNNAFSTNGTPSLHTIAYAARGLFEAGRILEYAPYVQAAIRTANALRSKQRVDGALHGEYGQGWQPTGNWSCLTGDAQTAIIWLKLYQRLGDEAYLTAAQKLNRFLKKTQRLNVKNRGIRGGIKGSHPIQGGYVPYAYPNWAAKFFLDALMLEENVNAPSHG
jgi:hypothetical protein